MSVCTCMVPNWHQTSISLPYNASDDLCLLFIPLPLFGYDFICSLEYGNILHSITANMLIDDIPTPAAHWWNPIFFGLHLSFTLLVPVCCGVLFECSRFHHNPSECIRGEIPFVIKGEREEQKHTHKPHYHVTENQNPSPHGAKTSTNQIYRQPLVHWWRSETAC